nr:class I SAM-dependent methyltransferase [Candidatus Freyarchaeota archaeon]
MSNKDVVERFDGVAESYDERTSKWPGYDKLIIRIVELANPRESDIVLDMGAGTGSVSFAFAPKVSRVVAMDIAEKMLKVGRKKAKENNLQNVEFRYGDFENPNYKEKVDIIVTNIAFHHLTHEQKRKVIRNWYDLLKPGGRVIIGDMMFFFDPIKERERAIKLMAVLAERYAVKKKGEDLKSTMERYKKTDHPIYVYTLKEFFEEAGYRVTAIEEIVPPILGIICAQK